MVKTTIVLDDELYRKLINQAIEKYGTTRTLSRLINEKLRGSESPREALETERLKEMEIVNKTAGIWKIQETGSAYVRRLRRGSEMRLRRLNVS